MSRNIEQGKAFLFGLNNKLISNRFISILGFYDSISIAEGMPIKPKNKLSNDRVATYIKLDGKNVFLLPKGAAKLTSSAMI